MTRVYLHGTGHSASIWAPMGGVQFDLPGHGRAPRIKERSVQAFADTVIADLPEAPVLIGHSLGGMVALNLAARLGPACRALVLLDAPLCLPTLHAPRLVEAATRLTMPELFSHFAGLRVPDPAQRRRLQRAIKEMNAGALRDAAIAAASYDGRPDLVAATCPILGLYARAGAIAGPIAAQTLRTYRPDAAFHWVSGGHMFPFMDWTRTNQKITRFLEGLE